MISYLMPKSLKIMNSSEIRKYFLQSCYQELNTLKPGNLNYNSIIPGMKKKKFQRAADVSSKILTSRHSIGKSIYLASNKCIMELGQNYNLGIILLCTPIIKNSLKGNFKLKNFKKELKRTLLSIDNEDTNYIIEAIKISRPAGLFNYSSKGDVNNYKKNSFTLDELAKISMHFDRISKCFVTAYDEIFQIALPYFRLEKKKFSEKIATEKLYIKFLTHDCDSHVKRKLGNYIAEAIKFKSKILMNKLDNCSKQRFYYLLKQFDHYLKAKYINPGTCADLTVTTLLIDKITDIVRYSNFNVY